MPNQRRNPMNSMWKAGRRAIRMMIEHAAACRAQRTKVYGGKGTPC